MTTFIQAKLKKSGDQTNIDRHKEGTNNSEYYIISKSILQRIIIPKSMIKQLFHVKKSTC